MRICHVTSLHPANDGRIFQKQCVSLTKEYEVVLVAPNVEDSVKDGVQIRGVKLPQGRLKRMLFLKRLLPLLKSIDAAVYQFHDPELLSIGLKVKKWGKKVIFDSHEDVPADIRQKPYLPSWLRPFLASRYASYEKKTLSKYDALISVTPSIVERLQTINPNAVMVTNYPIYKDLSSDRTFGNNVCFAGGVSPSWMHSNIIKAIEPLDVNYLLAGPSNEAYIKQLENTPGWPKVKYAGVIAHGKVIDMYHQCSAGLALYDYNGYLGGNLGTLGNTKIFEFMQAGIPVIATDFILWKEIITKYNCGICVNPRNVEEIRNAISYILNNKEKAKEMGDNGVRAFKEQYNWNTQEPVLFDLYKKVIAS